MPADPKAIWQFDHQFNVDIGKDREEESRDCRYGEKQSCRQRFGEWQLW